VDGLCLVVLAIFVLRGWHRGVLLEVFSLGGLLAAIVAASAVFQWLGEHWVDAEPAWLYAILQILVAALAGLALASVFHWIGTRAREAVREGPAHVLDAGAGLVAGAATGALVVTMLLLGAVLAPWPPEVSGLAARARVTAPALAGAGGVLDWGRKVIPGGRWLRGRIEEAEQRVRSSRTRARSTAV
jgi:hypothetical protein